MSDCPGERQTQHHRGRWFGFGPVRNNERVIFAVFENTPRHGAELTAKSFDTNLVSGTQSVARASLVSRATFDLQVVDTGVSAKGPFLGIALGRIEGAGRRGKPEVADYVLTFRNHKLAVIEAKARDKSDTEGVGQTKLYAGKLQARR